MRSPSSSLTIAALLSVAAVAAQPVPPRPADEKQASVAGEVRDSLTLQPIPRAHVVVRHYANGAWERYGALTADDGTFVINKIPVAGNQGGFEIHLDRTGYVDLTPQASSQTRLQPGENKTGVKLKLTPTGAISGRVLDSTGAPVEGITVSAVTGISPERIQRTAATDDRGIFRLGGLAPGKYRIAARPQTLPLPPEIRTDGTGELHHSPTYHPGELDAKNATRVEVVAAADVTGADIRLVRTPIVHISGRIAGMPERAQNVNVSLIRVGGGNSNGSGVKPDGSFEIWRVDPGKYTVTGQYYNAGEQWRSAPVEIEVGENDLDNIALQLMPPMELHGTSAFEDEDARKGPQPPPSAQQAQRNPQQQQQQPRRRVVMLREVSSDNTMGSAQLEEDGSFTLPRITPGQYRVFLSPPQAYVKSVEYGQTHTDGNQLDLRSGAAAPVTLHIATAAGSISGTVSDDAGPAAGVRMFLVEVGPRQPRPVTGESKPDGTYSFPNLAPGKYRLLASDEAESLLTNIDEDLEGVAELIELSDRQAVTKDVKKYVLPGRK